jgi:hypothetical protein
MFKTCSALALMLGVLWWTHRSFAREQGLEFFEADVPPVAKPRDPVIAGFRLWVQAAVLLPEDVGVDAFKRRPETGFDGAPDELRFRAVEGRFGVREPHATVLHRPGLDPENVSFRDSGRHSRPVEASGEVVGEVTPC